MLVERPVLHYALIELEALTPHAIHAGRGDITHDVLVMRDHNGLPALPGTSLAGVLRSLFERRHGTEACNQLFGYADAAGGRPSWVQVGAGLIHNSKNLPQEGLQANLEQDPLLAPLLQSKPLVRQRVRLNEKGAAADSAKFDTTLIPAGCRYSTLLSYWSDGTDAAETAFDQLLCLMKSPEFRIGHGTRSGSGAFRVNHLLTRRWNLTNPNEASEFQKFTRSRLNSQGLIEHQPTVDASPNWSSLQLELQAEAGWRIGGGEQAFSDPDTNGKVPDLVPQSEVRIEWLDNQGILTERQAVLPATAIKGALAHRFIFHYRRITGAFVMVTAESSLENALDNPGVQEVFGYINESSDLSGQAGRLIINDIYLDSCQIARQIHNKIDRFTGGVIKGALFEEEVLWKTPIKLEITLLEPDRITEASKQALLATLKDLESGWLPLGAGSSRGLGVFVASKPVQWLTNPLDQQQGVNQ
ncbi:MAG: hypothetical protein IBX50_14385 [Marinospirillum sp.]|uniref:RAMP superfamily CRISPR-associated protein n=1 Tax=Marinospirillum sp. TaxID=2183934 RepID=UPI001A015B36|nr:RAMP superfamily CRISPR-associated protein [Marinospirillum sp.]MBE0507876.1 hypothetical protein [Marinospirillum sp.]